jgi:hypothetical protein
MGKPGRPFDISLEKCDQPCGVFVFLRNNKFLRIILMKLIKNLDDE